MTMSAFYVFSIICASIHISISLKCNGFEELCDLDISQITLAGTHNSGAGFNGLLKYHTSVGKVTAVSCWYRSQMKSIYQQLQSGIRYLDIDSCWQDGYEPKGAWACHSGAYGGSIKQIIDEVDKWMNEPANRNEVIVIHFNRDFDKEDHVKTGENIVKLLSEKWNSRHDASRPLSIQSQHSIKLRRAIELNQRIYVIIHTQLARIPWAIQHYQVGYTWKDMAFPSSAGCYNLIKEMGKKRCSREAFHQFVRYDMYLSSGLCISDMASYCRQYIGEGVINCFQGTKTSRRTVNFIVVDYAGDEVVKITREQNIRNIKYYLGKDV